MGLAGEVGEYALSHGGTADVAMADEKYSYHKMPCNAEFCVGLSAFPGIVFFLFITTLFPIFIYQRKNYSYLLIHYQEYNMFPPYVLNTKIFFLL